jgi:hypothetical protein
MRLQEQRWAYEIERRRLILESASNGDFIVIVFGAVVGFAILFAMMFYIYSAAD